MVSSETNAKSFAQALRATRDERERSWNGTRYTMDFHEASKPYFSEAWAPIVNIVLLTGYADIWEWCDQVDPING